MRTVTVTIGRNVGSDPMPAERWHQFALETRRAVESVTPELWASGPHRSKWNGIPEEGRFFYGPLIDGPSVACVESAVRWLRAQLETLATKYDQDAIGVSWGESELVESFATPAPIGGAAL